MLRFTPRSFGFFVGLALICCLLFAGGAYGNKVSRLPFDGEDIEVPDSTGNYSVNHTLVYFESTVLFTGTPSRLLLQLRDDRNKNVTSCSIYSFFIRFQFFPFGNNRSLPVSWSSPYCVAGLYSSTFTLNSNMSDLNYIYVVAWIGENQVPDSPYARVLSGSVDVQRSLFSAKVFYGAGVFSVGLFDSYGNPATVPPNQQSYFKLNSCPRRKAVSGHLRFSPGELEANYSEADPHAPSCIYLSYSDYYSETNFIIGGVFTNLQNGSFASCQCAYSSLNGDHHPSSALIDSIPWELEVEDRHLILLLVVLVVAIFCYTVGVLSGFFIRTCRNRFASSDSTPSAKERLLGTF